MSSIFITYGLLGFPFLFGLMYDSNVNKRKDAAGNVTGKKHTYWEWVLVGLSISLGINILRYIRTAVKWKEAKQYILSKMGRGGDVDTSKNLEDSFGYYWKSVLFFPAWFLNYMLFPQGKIEFFVSFLFVSVFLGYTTYYATYWFSGKEVKRADGTKYESRDLGGAGAIAFFTVLGCIIASLLIGSYFSNRYIEEGAKYTKTKVKKSYESGKKFLEKYKVPPFNQGD